MVDSAVNFVSDDPQSRIAELCQTRGGIVTGCVIHADDLEVFDGLVEDRLEGLLDKCTVIIRGENDGYERRGGHENQRSGSRKETAERISLETIAPQSLQ